jgi:hypothetical protein
MFSFQVISRDYSRVVEENYKTLGHIGSVLFEVRTGHNPNTSQQLIHLGMKGVAPYRLITLHHNTVQLRMPVTTVMVMPANFLT